MHDNFVAIAMFAVIGLVLGLFYYFRYRTRAEMQQTVRVALERGQELSPELVDRLGEPRKSGAQDLRRGVISVLLAAGIAVFAFTLGEQEAFRPLMAIAALPLAIGIAYLILWRIDKSRDDESRDTR
jgi:preprotein translocase subunit YajC